MNPNPDEWTSTRIRVSYLEKLRKLSVQEHRSISLQLEAIIDKYIEQKEPQK